MDGSTEQARRPGDGQGSGATASGAAEKVMGVHRIGAIAVAAVLAAFGLLGIIGGLDFFDTEGEQIAGLSSNGLLSLVSLATAAVLVVAALRSARTASTIMIVVGVLFLVSAVAHLGIMRTDFNFLAFRLPNVFFSIGAGLVLLVLGAYGRVSGNLPSDNPYRTDDGSASEELDDDQQLPSTPAEIAAEEAMRDAELAVVNHTATPEQQRRVEAMARVRTRGDRRAVWMDLDARAVPVAAAEQSSSSKGRWLGRS
jgi:hypothetical protein